MFRRRNAIGCMRFNDPLNLMCKTPLQNNVKPMIQKEDMIKLQEYKINETTQEGSGFLDVLKNTFKTTPNKWL